MEHDEPQAVDWLRSLANGSEMGALVAAHDWAATELGPPDAWSSSLRTAVRVCLTTRFPMLVAWGPDLRMIYNDGYRQILGSEKHPHALGEPVKEVWIEIWDEISPLFDDVMLRGQSTWSEHQILQIERNGYPEHAWFTWSYSPLIDDDGTIGGVLDTCAETTQHVTTERRLACLAALAAEMVSGLEVTDVSTRATASLVRSPDLSWAELYLRAGDELVRLATARRSERDREFDADLVERVADTGMWVVAPDHGPARPARRIALPVAGGRGVLVLGLDRHLPFDDGYRSFVEVAASVVGTALESAIRRAAELGEERRINETLQQAMLKPAADLPTVAARYVPASGNLAVGGDWYDVIDLGDQRRGLVVGDCVGHGLKAAAAMGPLRSASRALLFEGRSPAAVLESMDRFAESIDAGCTTMVCAVVDLKRRAVTYASAGHPPMLLVRPCGTTWLEGSGGPPLAVPSGGRIDAEAEIDVGDRLVLYSDGLVERRGEAIDVGLERLRTAAVERYGDPVQAFIDGLLDDLLPTSSRDDVVVVVKEVPTHH